MTKPFEVSLKPMELFFRDNYMLDANENIVPKNPTTHQKPWKAGKRGSNKYLAIEVRHNGQKFYGLLHRLKFIVAHGYAPKQVDHDNQNKYDNRLANLRPCNGSLNAANRRKRSGCSSDYRGVSVHAKPFKDGAVRYVATITINGKSVHLGVFRCPVQAAMTYDFKLIEVYKEFANTNIIPNPYRTMTLPVASPKLPAKI